MSKFTLSNVSVIATCDFDSSTLLFADGGELL